MQDLVARLGGLAVKVDAINRSHRVACEALEVAMNALADYARSGPLYDESGNAVDTSEQARAAIKEIARLYDLEQRHDTTGARRHYPVDGGHTG